MPPQDNNGKSKESQSADFARAMLEFADERAKTGNRTEFAQYILNEAESIREGQRCGSQQSGSQWNQQCAKELLDQVNRLNVTHEKNSKMRKAINSLDGFFKAIRLYSNVVETLVSSNPAVSALIWGGLKFVMQLAGQYKQYFDNFTDLLKSLEHHLEHLGKLSEIFDWSQHLIAVIEKSFKDILLILEAAAEAYSESGLKTLLKGALGRLDRKSKELTARMEANKESLRVSAQIAQLYMTSKLLQEDQERKVNTWLDTPATDPFFEYCCEHKVPTTCNWLFDEAIYRTWEEATNIGGEERGPDQKNPLIVWICGPPGIGKTFLATSLVQRLLKEQGQKVIYYYFRDEKSGEPARPGKDEVLSMLRSLVRQLVDIDIALHPPSANELPGGLEKFYNESCGTPLSDITSAIKVMKHLFNRMSRIHVVIDGLDECINRYSDANPHSNNWSSKSDRKYLPFILAELTQSKYPGTIKWCFTSCPEGDLCILFRELNGLVLEVTGEHIKHDIETYMTNAWDLLPVQVEDDDKTLLQEISLITPNFLDTKLTLKALPRETNAGSALKKVLMFLKLSLEYKEGFNARYLRGLRVLASKPKKEKELARRILIFVTAAKRPLTKNELLEALQVTIDADFDCNPRPNFEMFEELLSPLLELDTSASHSNPTVRFIHRTAREFMQQDFCDLNNLPGNGECSEFFPDVERKNLELGKVCLTYLTHSCFQKRPQEANLDDKDEDCHSFLRYASIFWYQHLDFEPSRKDFQNSIFPDLFQQIWSFMRSRNFLTCLCVQGKYAPYLIARFIKSKRGMNIERPTAVFPQCSPSQLCYGDPFPEWVAHFNPEGKRLALGCHLLIKEFGLVLLRQRGGIRKCYSCLLGPALNFLPSEDDGKVLVLEKDHASDAASRLTRAKNSKYLSFYFTPFEATINIITIQQDIPALIIEEWKGKLSRKKKSAFKKFQLERMRNYALPQEFMGNAWNPPLNDITIQQQDCLLMSPSSQKLDLVKVDLATGKVDAAGLGIPKQHMSNLLGKDMCPTFHGQCCTANGALTVVSYCWSAKPYSQKDRCSKSSRTDSQSNSDSDSDSDSESGSDSNSDSDSDADSDADSYVKPSESYTSGSATSSTAVHQSLTWHSCIGIKQADNECQWHDFEIGNPLRLSTPVVYPAKPFVLLPLDGARTAVIDYTTQEYREINCPNEMQVVSRMYHFSSAKEKLFELVTTKEQGSRWTLYLNIVVFDVDPNNNLSTISMKRKGVSSVSWIPPYFTPYEDPDHDGLPFTITWADKHLYIVFGACEVYLTRMLLNPCENEQESLEAPGNEGNLPLCAEEEKLSLPRVELTKEPAFLPASTTERSFRYIPNEASDEYGAFAISGNTELPPVLLRQDIKDLGGWIEYDISTNVGGSGDGENHDMRGQYASDVCYFEVPVRSGLSWDVRTALRCR